MYHTIVVDDEMPTLRFIHSLLEKYAPEFQVDALLPSGEKALAYLQDHQVDLLITDITMYDTNGIELSSVARMLYPDIHIVIISDYAESEYAQGAIKASVDEYLLKPIEILDFKSVLDRVVSSLDAQYSQRRSDLLSALVCGTPYDQSAFDTFFQNKEFRFSLVRWGNPDIRLSSSLTKTCAIPTPNDRFIALEGRDADEHILLSPQQDSVTYLADLGIYMSQRNHRSNWTVIYSSSIQPIDQLPAFIPEAMSILDESAIIGRNQMIAHPQCTRPQELINISSADIKMMTYLAKSGKMHQFKEHLLALVMEWEKLQAPHAQVWAAVCQIAHHLSVSIPVLNKRIDTIIRDLLEILHCSQSYGELVAGLYSVLFDEYQSPETKIISQELYNHITEYIDSHYASPLSMQSVCEEIDISRAYLSRLFRRYGDTTFNTYLTQCRINASVDLLQTHPEYRMREIAAIVGYDSPSYWSKVFHRTLGCTPSEYINRKK